MGRGPVRVLLIEDEPRIVEIVRRGLAVHHIAMDARADGVSGLRAAVGNGHYDVIVLDIQLSITIEVRCRG